MLRLNHGPGKGACESSTWSKDRAFSIAGTGWIAKGAEGVPWH